MRLVTFTDGGGAGPRLGALGDGDRRVVDLSASGEPDLASMQALIDAGPDGLAAARAAADGGASVAVGDVTLLAPVPVPAQIRDCLCFEEHLANCYKILRQRNDAPVDDPRFQVPAVFYQQPIYYKANRFACIGTGADIEWPRYGELLDYELEMACWIGRRGRDIAAEDADDFIFGYSVFNDVSARDAQLVESPGGLGPAKGKDFDTANVLGPCIVTADELDVSDLAMVTRINGEEVARGTSASRTWTFPQVIAHISQSETLHPGEVLGSGTVGWGCGFERGVFLAPGDLIELEIEGIGVLRNRIVKRESA
jgi:2-keto-4-pentenoate hydratase/2-oxohepta-3-ene-1,7-dioic acid hydratase in catechol pathway